MPKAVSVLPAKLRFLDTRASVFLDLIRGLAALVVLFHHWRYLLFVDYPQISGRRALFALPYLLASCGHQAVVVFFVLSGYLVGGSVLRMFAGDAWSWKSYLAHRLVRLWIVLLPGIGLCYLLDWIGLRSALAPLLYHGQTGTHILFDVASRHSPLIAIENIFFLQTIRAPALGSDGALWSLANEFWYYILFPLGLLVIYPRRSLRTRAAAGLAFLAVACFCGIGIMASFPIWLFGVGLALFRVPALPSGVRAVSAATYSGVFLLTGILTRDFSLGIDYVLAACTVLFLGCILSAKDAVRNTAGEWLSRRLSAFSFTLYVVHTPICVLLTAVLAGDARWQPTPMHLMEGSLILLVALVSAFCLASLTEFHTERLRQQVERLLSIPPPRR